MPGVARSLGDADFKRGVRMNNYSWSYPKGVAREFTGDIVCGEPDVCEVGAAEVSLLAVSRLVVDGFDHFVKVGTTCAH